MGRRNSLLSCSVFLLATILALSGSVLTDGIQDYAVDLFYDSSTQGYIQIPPIPGIGCGGIATFEIQFNGKGLYYSGTLFELSTAGVDAAYIAIELSGGAFNFWIGKTNKISVAAVSGIQTGWHTISVVLGLDAAHSNQQTIWFYLDGNLIKTQVQAFSIPYNDRSGFLGKGTGPSKTPFPGLIDNFIIWKTQRTQAQISPFVNRPLWDVTYDEELQIVGWFSFEEGFGNTAAAITDTSAPDQRWIEATLFQAFWNVKNWQQLTHCYAWGDPHIYDWHGNGVSYGEKSLPTLMYTTCKDIFEIRAYHRYTEWWGNTVNRITTIRAFDHFFQFALNENEGNDYAPGTPSWYPDRRLGLYEKYGNGSQASLTASWQKVAQGSYTDKNDVFYSVSYSGCSASFKIIVPNVGYVTISTGGQYQNIDIYLSLSFCNDTSRLKGVCDYILTEYRDIDFKDWLYPPVNVPDPNPPPLEDPCANQTAAFIAEVDAICSKYGSSTSNPFKDCVTDSCISGDPELTISNPPTKECTLNQLLAANGQASTNTTACELCPNDCSNRGKCLSTGCQCDSGYVGEDCGTPYSWGCYDLNISTDDVVRHLSALTALYIENIVTVYSNRFLVEDSILFYILEQPTSPTSNVSLNRYIVIVADKSVSNDGGQATVSLHFSASVVGVPVQIVGTGSTPAASVSGSTISIGLSWNAFKYTGAIIGPLPFPFTVSSVSVVSTLNVKQVLIATAANGELDPIRIPSSLWPSFQLSGYLCLADPCAEIVSCKQCAALPQCGFCVDNARCIRGDNAGPLIGDCKNWRFSFDSNISRRVTTDFGWPVSPELSEVFLTSSNTGTLDVPVDVRVNMGEAYIVWDVVIFLEDVTAGSEDYVQIQNIFANKLLPALAVEATYPDMRLGLGTFSTDGNTVRLLQDLTSVEPNNQWVFKRALAGMTGSAGGVSANGHMKTLYFSSTSQQQPNWRTNARRMTIVIANSDYCKSNCNYTPQSIQIGLLNSHVVPVFLTASSVQSSFDNLVGDIDELGFGIVLPLSSDLSNLNTLVEKAIRLATGQISLVIENSGHIERDVVSAESFNIFGLDSNFRARFVIPMKRAHPGNSSATLIAPGFGSTTINDIDSDLPTCITTSISGSEDTDIKTCLQGSSLHNLLNIYPVIETLPANGTLYQVNEDGTRGDPITAGEIVTNSGGQIIFRANPNEYSYPSNSPYASFQYFVTDGCAESLPSTVKVYITPTPDAPTAYPSTATTPEDNAVSLVINFADPDVSSSDNVTPQPLSFILTTDASSSISSCDNPSTPLTLLVAYPLSSSSPRTFCVTYTPVLNFNGEYTFTYKAIDSTNYASAPATGTVTVTPVNDPPTIFVGTPIVVKEDNITGITLTASDVDGNDKPSYTDLSITLVLSNSFKGYFYESPSGGTPIVAGSTTTFTSANFPSATFSKVLYFQSLFEDFSCLENDSVVTEATATCPPYTSFSFYASDNDNKVQPYDLSSPTGSANIYVVMTEHPPAVPASLNETTYEDTYIDIQLTATDPDNSHGQVQRIDLVIVQFPDLATQGQLLQLPSLQPVPQAGNVTNSTGWVRFVPAANVFGNPTGGWYLTTFSYKAFDGILYSDTADVIVNVIAVNDPPVPLLTSVTGIEDSFGTLVFLTGSDIDTPISRLHYLLTSLPNASQASLHFYDEAANETIGDAITSINTVVPLGCGSDHTYDACVWLVSVQFFYGNGTFSYNLTDEDVYRNAVNNTVAVPVSTYIKPVNHAPHAAMDTPIATEDVVSILTLTGSDRENDPLEAIISTPLFSGDSDCSLVGIMYQYNSTLSLDAATYAQSGSPIVNANTIVSDSLGRVVYVPPPNKNTQESLNWNHIQPYFSYYVKEVSSEFEPAYLESVSQLIPITVTQVNDAPVVWQDSWMVDTNLTNACYSTCTFDEDLDVQWRQSQTSVPIWFGGNDVEKQPLSIILTSVDCPSTAILRTVEANPQLVPISTTLNYQLPTTVPLTAPALCTDTVDDGTLVQGLSFTPGLDDNNANSGRNGYYCKITYIVKDSQGASSGSKVITINITPIDDQPRPNPPNNTLVVITMLEDTTANINVVGLDPETGTSSVYLLTQSCTSSKGVFAVSGTAVSCSQYQIFSSTDGTFALTFIPNPTENGMNYNNLYYTFLDTNVIPPNNSIATLDTYQYQINVRPFNDNCTHAVLGNLATQAYQVTTFARQTFRLSDGSNGVSLNISVKDIDLYPSTAQGNVTITISVDPASGQTITPTLTLPANRIQSGVSVSPNTATLKTLTGPAVAVNATLSFLTAKWVPGNGAFSFNLRVNASDNGNTGLCLDLNPCVTWTASVTPGRVQEDSTFNTLLVAGAAAGAVIVAGAAGIGAWRKFTKPKDGYEPWKDITMPDIGAISNPMYESNTLTGTNPFYADPSSTVST